VQAADDSMSSHANASTLANRSNLDRFPCMGSADRQRRMRTTFVDRDHLNVCGEYDGVHRARRKAACRRRAARLEAAKSTQPLRAGGGHLARDGGGFELSARRRRRRRRCHRPLRETHAARGSAPCAAPLARHLADFPGSEMSELLPCERCTVLMISPVEKNCVKMRIESQVTRRALHRRQRSSLGPRYTAHPRPLRVERVHARDEDAPQCAEQGAVH